MRRSSLLVLALALVPPIAGAAQKTGRVTGRILDGSSGAPLQGAVVEMLRPGSASCAQHRQPHRPGEERKLVLPLGPEHLRMLDRDLRWIVEPGAFRVMVGDSSRDIRLRGMLDVRE